MRQLGHASALSSPGLGDGRIWLRKKPSELLSELSTFKWRIKKSRPS